MDKTSSITEKAFHSAIEIKAFYEGRSLQLIGPETVLAEAGDITIANPYEIHTNLQTEEFNGKYYLILIEADFFRNTEPLNTALQNIFIANGTAFHRHIRQNDRLNRIIKQTVWESEHRQKYYQAVIRGLMEEFFLLLLRNEVCFTNEETRIKKVQLIAPAINKIFSDYNQPIAVDELAALCHVSKYHFCRVFKEVTGESPIGYLMHHRIQMAEALLSGSSKSIKQVADECGFRDLSYFYRCYKKITGESPRK